MPLRPPDRDSKKRGEGANHLLPREDRGLRKVVAHRTFRCVETSWAPFGEGAWVGRRLFFVIFGCLALFFFG